jgi:hypothetical protein
MRSELLVALEKLGQFPLQTAMFTGTMYHAASSEIIPFCLSNFCMNTGNKSMRSARKVLK